MTDTYARLIAALGAVQADLDEKLRTAPERELDDLQRAMTYARATLAAVYCAETKADWIDEATA